MRGGLLFSSPFVSILVFLACFKIHCSVFFFLLSFPSIFMFFHSRSKRNVKRVSASLESFHFTRAKKTWPRKAADRNVSSSREQRADHPQPHPLCLSCTQDWASVCVCVFVRTHTCVSIRPLCACMFLCVCVPAYLQSQGRNWSV